MVKSIQSTGRKSQIPSNEKYENDQDQLTQIHCLSPIPKSTI